MVDVLLGEVAAMMLVGGSAFLLSAMLLFLAWTFAVRMFGSLAERGHARFLGALLHELGAQMSVLILLVSSYIGIATASPSFPGSPAFGVWAVATLLVAISIIARTAIVLVEHYCKTTPSMRVLATKLAFIKVTINFLLYSLAVIFAVDIIHPQLGAVVAALGYLLLIFAFILFHDQLKNLLAGTQLLGGRIKQGDFIEAGGVRGTVEEIRGRRTLVRTASGVASVPNSMLAREELVNHSVAGGGNLARVVFGVAGADFAAGKKVASEAARRISRAGWVMREQPPSAVFEGVEDGSAVFSVRFAAAPGKDAEEAIREAKEIAAKAALAAKKKLSFLR